MKVLIDADGCPVVDIAIEIAKENKVECVIMCDTSHVFERDGARTITLSKGADSVDFALVNLAQKDDVVVTQDYGLAAMCIGRCYAVISQDGMEYTDFNIDGLLLQRHSAKKIRMAGGRIRGAAKRTPQQDENFKNTLHRVLKNK